MTSEQFEVHLDENDPQVTKEWADEMEEVCTTALDRPLDCEDWRLILIAVLQDRAHRLPSPAASSAESGEG